MPTTRLLILGMYPRTAAARRGGVGEESVRMTAEA
jgi:hypothetical protein